MKPEGRRLAEFSAAVRESTLKRLRAVPEGKEHFRIDAESMSFADLAQHLLESDRRLLLRLGRSTPPPPVRTRARSGVRGRRAYLALVGRLERGGEKRRKFLAGLSPRKLERVVDDPYYGRAADWWYILRSTLDHEIHHRGQIAVMLRLSRK